MTHHPRFTRENVATLERRDAAMRPSSFNADAHTVEAVIATSNPVARRDERGQDFDEVLSMDGADLSAIIGASVLDSHNSNGVRSVIGVVEDCRRDGETLVARIRFSTRPEVASVVADIRDGVIRNLSVGYEVAEWRDGEANGRRQRIAAKWKPREVSFVAVPADPNARTRQQGDGELATRNRAIRELGARCGLSRDLIDTLIDGGQPIEIVRAEMLRHLENRSRIEIRTGAQPILDDPIVFTRALGGGLYASATPGYTPTGPEREFASFTLADAARELLRRAGVATTGMRDATLIERAAYMTTSDFALILDDVVGRAMREPYAAPAAGIRAVARQTTAKDFRAKRSLVLDNSGTLQPVGEHGEFKSSPLVEAGEQYAIATYGDIVNVTRKVQVNDDVGAFTDLGRRQAEKAIAFESQQLVDLLEANTGLGPTMSDNATLFDSSHGNVAGTGAAPDSNTLSAARLALRKQTSPGGNLIAVRPKWLLIPSELETSVEQLVASISPTTVEDAQIWSFLVPIVEPRLRDATRWYLVADNLAGLEYAYLASEPGPQVSTKVGFEIDGTSLKVRLDFGAGFVEWRSWYSNEGAEGELMQLRHATKKGKAAS